MADSLSTKAALEGLLKEVYIDGIRDQFSYGRPVDRLLQKNSRDVEGKYAVISVRLGPNTSAGYRDENATLPDSKTQVIKKVQVPLRYLYMVGQITGQLIKASRTNRGAFAKALTDDMENMVKEIRKVSNFFNFGTGSGVVAKVTSVPDANTIVVDRWSRLFCVNRVLDSYTAITGGSQGMNSKAISAADKATRTLTITSHGASANDYIFLEDSRGVCQMGLMGIFDNNTFLTTFQGLSRSDYPDWQGKVMSNSGTARNLTEGLLMDGIAGLRDDDVNPDIIVCTSFALNDVAKELQQQRQFVNPRKKLEGGIVAVDINGVPLTFDPDCPAGYAWMFRMEDVEFFVQGDLEWMDLDGSILSRASRKDAYEYTLEYYREMGAHRCNSGIRIEDLYENRPSGL